jgi:hypothetical protein
MDFLIFWKSPLNFFENGVCFFNFYILYLIFILLGISFIWHKDEGLIVGLGRKKLTHYLTFFRISYIYLFPRSIDLTVPNRPINTYITTLILKIRSLNWDWNYFNSFSNFCFFFLFIILCIFQLLVISWLSSYNFIINIFFVVEIEVEVRILFFLSQE